MRKFRSIFTAGVAVIVLTACGGGDTGVVEQPAAAVQPSPAPLPTPQPIPPQPPPAINPEPVTLAVIQQPAPTAAPAYQPPTMPNVEPYPVPSTGCTHNGQVWECEP